MAYIVGLLKPEEKKELERRGWDVEKSPKGFAKSDAARRDGLEYCMVYVDNNMLEIMSGSDWNKGLPKKAKVTIRDIQVTEREVEIPTTCPKCKADLYSHEEDNLHVWGYSDQGRNGHLHNDGNEEDDHNSSDGVNTANSDLGGGDNFISNVGIYCKCGYTIAEGKFDVIECKDSRDFLVEVREKGNPFTSWLLFDTYDSSEDAESCMQKLVDRKSYAGVRVVLRDTKQGVIKSVVLHVWPIAANLSAQPSDRKKTDAKK
jgi:hypothetical protein